MTSEIGKHSTMYASLLLSILWTMALVWAENHQRTPLDEKSTVLLQHAVKSLLGFKDLPSRGTDASLSMNPSTFEVAPKYMLDLYNKYKYGTITKGKKTSNTVRSIKPQIGVINGEYMFVFNLSSVMASEKVLSGEIHLYKRKLNGLDTTLRLLLHEISPSRLSKTGIVKMQTQSHGWQAVDITNTVKSCISSRGQSPHLLAVSIGIEEPDGNYGPMSLDKFSQNISKPYLIVFSNDTQNITLDHLDPRFDPKDLKKVFTTGDPDGDKPIKKGKRPKRSLLQSKLMTSLEENKPMLSDSHISQNNFVDRKLSPREYRRKRSIYDNEIPEESQAVDKSKNLAHNLPKTHPGMLQGRQQSKNKSKDSKLIPYPERYEGRRHRRRKYRKNRRRKNRNRHLPFPKHWKKKENLATFGHKEQLCGKRKLVVDFADIGWSEWIISPKSFEAHYCTGKCPFPLTKGMKPSNHATIQSIVHAIGLHSQVPSPCCVPDSMSSVTLLYFDENRNVVLKNYPSMTVQSCACR